MTYRSIPPISVHPKWIGWPVVGRAGKEPPHLAVTRVTRLTRRSVEPVSGKQEPIRHYQPYQAAERQGQPTERQIETAGGHALTVAPVPSVFRTQDRIDGSS